MERKDKNFASKGAKTAMSLVLALSLVPSSALAEIANTQEVTQTQEVAATQTSDATASTSEVTAETSTETTTNTEVTSNQQTSEQATAPTERSSRRVTRSLSYITNELWVDGTNGNDTNEGSSSDPLKSLQKALELWGETSSINTIHLKGNLNLTSTVTIPSGLTLKIEDEGATLTGTGNSIDGLVLSPGSILTGTGTLTMSGFKTALTAEDGSTITDGTYVFRNNAGSSGTRGISLGGTVSGSTNKNSVTITADDKSNTNFFESGVTFENATINVTSQARTWNDARNLTLRNADLKVEGFGQTFYVNQLNMTDSTLTINPSFWGQTGMTIQGSSNIVNSTINANAGSTSGISVAHPTR